MYVALLIPALLAGCLLAVQASANLQLTRAVGTPYGASTLQLTLAASVLIILAAATGTVGAVALVAEAPAWSLLGGLASPLYITSGILLFPRLGALAAVGLFVTGQTFASLGLDLFGLIGVPRASMTAGIVVGAAAILTGITLIIRGQTGGAGGRPAAAPADGENGAAVATAVVVEPARLKAAVSRAGWLALGVTAGAGLPVQGAVNAQLRTAIDAPLAVAAISFTVATVAIGIVLVVLLAARATPIPVFKPLGRMPWWGWLGGLCAAAYVTATFMLIPQIGAATTVALTVTGQQLASAVIDQRGLFRMPTRTLTPRRLAGLLLLVAGSALVQFG